VTNDPPRDWFVDLGDYMPTDENADNQIEWVMTPWAERHGLDRESLGFIPQFLHADDPRSAAEQIDASYQHGGGWKPRPDAPWHLDAKRGVMVYGDGNDPGDVNHMVASAKLRDETIQLYESAWTAIVQPDGSFEVSRLD
jgi:hypothetical protein